MHEHFFTFNVVELRYTQNGGDENAALYNLCTAALYNLCTVLAATDFTYS